MTASIATREVTDTQGMNYLVSLPRKLVTVWLPLMVFLIVLLFPFYWMVITTFKPNEELLSREGNPFWVIHPTLDHIKKLLFDTAYPEWTCSNHAPIPGRETRDMARADYQALDRTTRIVAYGTSWLERQESGSRTYRAGSRRRVACR